ncbi:MAG: N-acetylmuramoyl-L-alanine amidase [Oscillospiraceae bacterium]
MPRVFIGVGHGGNDPGAVANGLREADINLGMAIPMYDELLRHGVTVGISRTKDENDPLTEEIQEANAFGPDIAIDVHNNAGGGDGFEVYRQTNQYATKSLKLAEHLEARVKELGQNSRGVKTRLYNGADYFGWLRQVKCPAVLCEGAFVDNKTDVQIINTEEKQKAFGVAYAKAVLDYFGIAWKPETGSKVLYGVVGQKIALSSREAAEEHARLLNAGTDGDYYKVIEIER